MKRRTAAPVSSSGAQLAPTQVPATGRASRARLRLGLGLVILGAAAYIVSSRGQRVQSPARDTHIVTADLKQRIVRWMEDKTNVTGFGHASVLDHRHQGDTEAEEVRLLQNCAADEVTADAGKELGRLGGARGHRRLVFSAASWCRHNLGIASVEGRWAEAGLEGAANITYTDGRVALASLRRGVMCGEVRTLRTEWDEAEAGGVTSAAQLDSLVTFARGRPDPRVLASWFPVGGGLVQCAPDEDGLAAGADCVYLYPDLSTALRGEWRSGRMVAAVEAELVGLHVESGDIRLLVETVRSRENVKYSLDVSTSTRISSRPRLEDPYEQKTVYVAESMIEAAGDGLFLRRDVEAGDLVAIYNGVRLSEHEARLRKEDRRSVYRIHGWDNTILNIPRAAQTIDTYAASLGHKINHAKATAASAEFRFLEHPRFGEVVGVYMLRPGSAGTELTVDYGYMEKALATEAGLDMLLDAAKVFSGIEDTRDFKNEMKRAIGFIREKVVHLKPLINTMKMAHSFMS